MPTKPANACRKISDRNLGVGTLIRLVGYLSVGFIIWGGFKYILAQGEPSGLVAAKKTIINAMIGLIIAILAYAIINTIMHFAVGQGATL